MFLAGDEFLQTQQGNNNPYNQDNKTTWLDWDRLREHQTIFRFFRLMIAFRKAHPTLCRSRFWREDISWHGVDQDVDISYESSSLAYCLRGESVADDDLYVMINAESEEKNFVIQDGKALEWFRVIDTSRKSPHDICEAGHEVAVQSKHYLVKPESIVVFIRFREQR